MEPLVVICPQVEENSRLSAVLAHALEGRPHVKLQRPDELRPMEGRRVLFAISLLHGGVNLGWYAMLSAIRQDRQFFEGCCGAVLVDGLGVGDVGNIVLNDRKHLSQDGLIIVAMAFDRTNCMLVSGPDVISRGFVYVRENEDIIEGIRNTVRNIIASYGRIEGSDWPSIKNRIKDELHRYIYDKIKRNPMILPIIVDLG